MTDTTTKEAAIVAALAPVTFRDGEWIDGPIGEVVRLLAPLVAAPEPDLAADLADHAEQVYTVRFTAGLPAPLKPPTVAYAFRCDRCDVTGDRWLAYDQADRDGYVHIYGEDD